MKWRILQHPKLREKWQLLQISWFQHIDLSEICILMVVLYVCTPSSYSKMPPPSFYLLLMLQWLRNHRLLVFPVKINYRLVTSTGVLLNAAKPSGLPSFTVDCQQYPALTRERTKKQCTYNLTLERVMVVSTAFVWNISNSKKHSAK
jgi:hypothetical protein